MQNSKMGTTKEVVRGTQRGMARVGELRRVMNSVLTEVANGSKKLPLRVIQTEEKTVYRIEHDGVIFTMHVSEKGGEV